MMITIIVQSSNIPMDTVVLVLQKIAIASCSSRTASVNHAQKVKFKTYTIARDAMKTNAQDKTKSCSQETHTIAGDAKLASSHSLSQTNIKLLV